MSNGSLPAGNAGGCVSAPHGAACSRTTRGRSLRAWRTLARELSARGALAACAFCASDALAACALCACDVVTARALSARGAFAACGIAARDRAALAAAATAIGVDACSVPQCTQKRAPAGLSRPQLAHFIASSPDDSSATVRAYAACLALPPGDERNPSYIVPKKRARRARMRIFTRQPVVSRAKHATWRNVDQSFILGTPLLIDRICHRRPY